MVDWKELKAKNPELYGRCAKLMGMCFYGKQGICATVEDVKTSALALKESGFVPMAFGINMNFVKIVKDLLGDDYCTLHNAIAYPTGRMTVKKKLKDMETRLEIGIKDVCVCLDWQTIYSHRYKDLETEVKAMVDLYQPQLKRMALVIPAAMMSDNEIIETCKVLDACGANAVKVNPGVNMCVSFEEIALIQRYFPDRFELHPSGGIRTIEDVERYIELGMYVIHTRSSLLITEQFAERELAKMGEGVQ